MLLRWSVFVAALVSTAAYGADRSLWAKMTLKDLTTALTYYESKIQDISIDYHMGWGTYEGDFPNGKFVHDPGVGCDGRWVAKGPPGGLLWNEARSNTWFKSESTVKTGWTHTIYAFDGTNTRYFFESTAVEPELGPPKFFGQSGIITPGLHRRLIPLKGFRTPEHYTFRYFAPIPIAEVLANSEVKILGADSIDGTECLVVEIGGVKPLMDMEIWPLLTRFWLDPSKGYSPIRITRRDFSRKRYLCGVATGIELKECAPDVWLPVKALWLTYRKKDGSVERFLSHEAKKIEVNKGIPDEFFTLRFAPGLDVSDERVGVKYRIAHPAATLENLTMASVERASGLLADASEGKRGAVMVLLITSLSVAVLAFMGAALLRRLMRRGKRTAVCLLIAALGLTGLASRLVSASEGNGASSKVTGSVRRADSCGVNSLAFALMWLEVDVSIDDLVRELTPGPEGACSLADLRMAAERRGVRATPVKAMGMPALRRYLAEPGRAAVLYLANRSMTHFVAACGSTRNGLVVSDFPHPAQVVPWEKLRPFFERGGSCALLLGGPGPKTHASSRLRVALTRAAIPVSGMVAIAVCVAAARRGRRRE